MLACPDNELVRTTSSLVRNNELACPEHTSLSWKFGTHFPFVFSVFSKELTLVKGPFRSGTDTHFRDVDAVPNKELARMRSRTKSSRPRLKKVGLADEKENDAKPLISN